MHYVIVDKKNQVINSGTSAQLFPNVSFPDGVPTEDYLKENNAFLVSVDVDHNSNTQHKIVCDPYEKDGVWYAVEVVDMTSENKKAHKQAQKDFDAMTTYTDVEVNNAK